MGEPIGIRWGTGQVSVPTDTSDHQYDDLLSDDVKKFVQEMITQKMVEMIEEDTNKIIYGTNTPIVKSSRGGGGKSLTLAAAIGALVESMYDEEEEGDTPLPSPNTDDDLEWIGPGAFAGYRAFKIVRRANCPPALASLTSYGSPNKIDHMEWDHEKNEAICGVQHTSFFNSGRDHPNEKAPAMECTCGFWAYSTYEWLHAEKLTNYGPGEIVYALVAGWGKYVKTEYGFRTQYMRPLAVLTPHPQDLKNLAAVRLKDIDIPVVDLATVPTLIEAYELTTIKPEFLPYQGAVEYIHWEDETHQWADSLAGLHKWEDEVVWETGPIQRFDAGYDLPTKGELAVERLGLLSDPKSIVKASSA